MFWTTAVTSIALTGLAWGACPPGGVPTVGGPLTRSCLLTPVAGDDQKAGSKKDLVDRGDVGNAVRDFVKDVLSEGGLQGLASDVQAVQQEGAGEYALNKARAYGDRALHSVVSSLVNTAKKRSDSDFFKNLDVTYDYNFGDTKTWTATVSTLFSLWKIKSNLVFSQVNVLYTEKRPTVNVGVGDRYIDPGHTFLVGANAFFDYDFKGKNSRVSVGAEGMVKYAKLSANYYRHMSDWHNSLVQPENRGFLLQERAADGFDVRLKGYMPFYPQIAATARFYQWYGDKVNLFSLNDTTHGTKDPKGYAVGVAYRPNSLFNLGVEYAHGVGNSQKGTKVTFGAHYQFGVPFKQQMAMSTPLMDVSAHLYDKVDRENRIILARRDLLKMALGRQVYRKDISQLTSFQVKVVLTGAKAKEAKLSWSFPRETGQFMADPGNNPEATFDPQKTSGTTPRKNFLYPFTVKATLRDGSKVSRTGYVLYEEHPLEAEQQGMQTQDFQRGGTVTDLVFHTTLSGGSGSQYAAGKPMIEKAPLQYMNRGARSWAPGDASWVKVAVAGHQATVTVTPYDPALKDNTLYRIHVLYFIPHTSQKVLMTYTMVVRGISSPPTQGTAKCRMDGSITDGNHGEAAIECTVISVLSKESFSLTNDSKMFYIVTHPKGISFESNGAFHSDKTLDDISQFSHKKNSLTISVQEEPFPCLKQNNEMEKHSYFCVLLTLKGSPLPVAYIPLQAVATGENLMAQGEGHLKKDYSKFGMESSFFRLRRKAP